MKTPAEGGVLDPALHLAISHVRFDAIEQCSPRLMAEAMRGEISRDEAQITAPARRLLHRAGYDLLVRLGYSTACRAQQIVEELYPAGWRSKSGMFFI